MLLIISFVLSLSLPSSANHEPGVAKKNQLEELFIWKLSDELKLGPIEDKKFSTLVRSLNQKKLDNTLKIEQVTKDLLSAKSDKEKEQVLKNLKRAYQDYNQLSITELDEMKKLLGIQRLTHYLEVKQELTAKVKSLLIQKNDDHSKKESTAKKDLPPPKIIEEKKQD